MYISVYEIVPTRNLRIVSWTFSTTKNWSYEPSNVIVSKFALCLSIKLTESSSSEKMAITNKNVSKSLRVIFYGVFFLEPKKCKNRKLFDVWIYKNFSISSNERKFSCFIIWIYRICGRYCFKIIIRFRIRCLQNIPLFDESEARRTGAFHFESSFCIRLGKPISFSIFTVGRFLVYSTKIHIRLELELLFSYL